MRPCLERTKRAQAKRQEEEVQEELISTRRAVPFWRSKTCIALTLAVAAAAALAAYFLTGEKNVAGSTAPNNVDTGSNVTTTTPTTASPTTSPPAGDGHDIFQPPSSEVCSKVSEGLPVNGQEEMNIVQPVLITMNVYLLADIQRDLWLPGMVDNICKNW